MILFCYIEITLRKKSKVFAIGVSPLPFLGSYELIINILYKVKPLQKGFTFAIVEFHSLIY